MHDQLPAPARRVVEEYLRTVQDGISGPGRTRADVVAELRDGLFEATSAHLATGLRPEQAASDAVGEFGDPAVVCHAFRSEISAGHARRVSFRLLLSGPFVGLLWLAGLLPHALSPGHGTPGAWIGLLLAAPAIVAGIPAAVLAIASTSIRVPMKFSDAFPAHAAAVATWAAGTSDLILLIALGGYLVAASVPTVGPLAALAATASLARLLLATKAAQHCHQWAGTGGRP